MIWTDKDDFLEIIKDKKRYGVFLDMGVGKTALLLALCDYKFFQDVKKVLIITPKMVSLSTWQDEIDKWENFSYLSQIVTLVEGTETKRNKILEQTTDFCIHIISSSLTEWLIGKKVKDGKKTKFIPNKKTPNYDLIIVDECSQFKDTRANRFKALKKLSKDKELFLLSGTAFSNIRKEKKGKKEYYKKPTELYYIFNLLGIYGGSVTSFEQDFCISLPWDKFNIYMSIETYDTLIETLNKYCIRKKLDIDIQKKEYIIYCDVDLERMKLLKEEYVIETEGLFNITASNKAVMLNKSLQLSNGFAYGTRKIAQRFNTYKFDKLMELLTIIDDNVIIFYNFEEDKNFLLANLPGAKSYETDADKDAWNNKEIKYLILSPFSAKYGLNLQMGGHTIIWYGLIWSAESYQQANSRLYRTGQTKDVEIYYLLASNSFDEYVYDVLILKNDAIDRFKSFIENEPSVK
jgi:SNF2 family DNA or RNA helicase